MAIPSGYHIEEERPKGLLLSGWLTLGGAYAYAFGSGAMGGFSNGEGWLVLPIAGPWAAIASRGSPCNITTVEDFSPQNRAIIQKCVEDVVTEGVRLTVLAFDGVMQLLGGGLLVAGFATKETFLVRNDVKLNSALNLTLRPRAWGRVGYGLHLSGEF